MIGVLYHPKIPASRPLAEEMASWLQDHGQTVWLGTNWGSNIPDEQLPQSRLLIVLGGDGSMLRAARLATPYQIPLLGVNMGRIGFLCEVQTDNWQDPLARVLADDIWLERRLMLMMVWQRQGVVMGTSRALNDIVVSRGMQARVVTLHLHVDDDFVTTYRADGLIVATPTGSTAYAMAGGGPILPPQLQNFLVVPVAPYLSFDRALVLPQASRLMIQVEMDHEATVTVDGQAGKGLESGDKILIQRYEYDTLLARVNPPNYFYRTLLARLGVEEGSI
ncbi:MAG TPA: NAD(+)/NADH kinase [Anaerolineae bacterium]|nr:NAD(+)/NADH kinase [Anaerolineae bacterium]